MNGTIDRRKQGVERGVEEVREGGGHGGETVRGKQQGRKEKREEFDTSVQSAENV